MSGDVGNPAATPTENPDIFGDDRWLCLVSCALSCGITGNTIFIANLICVLY